MPTDLPAGYLSVAETDAAGNSLEWRRAIHRALNEVGSTPVQASVPRASPSPFASAPWGFETPTSARPKASCFVSGNQINLIYSHNSHLLEKPEWANLAWITANFCAVEDDRAQNDAQTRAPRSFMTPPEHPALPAFENVSGCEGIEPKLENPKGLNLDYTRSPAAPGAQHLI